MKHINKFIDTNLLDAEITRLQDLLQDLKRSNAMYRTRLRRLLKVRSDLKHVELPLVKAGED